MDRRQCLLTGGAVVSGLLGGVGAATAAATARPTEGSHGRPPVSRRQDGGPDGTEPIETSYSGTGATVGLDVRIERRGPIVFDMRHGGSGSFVVDVVDADGTRIERTVNYTGPWSGELAYDIEPGAYELRVQAGGSWSITLVQQPLYELADVGTTPPVEFEGSSPQLYGPIDFSAPRTLSFTSDGEDHNVLILHDASGERLSVLVNETSPVETSIEISIAQDVGWLSVDTDGGSYTLSVE
ncbi:hypothetical protein [Halorarum halobium]|uniref:hypothetical protein n=1 Tax=Halorarum halobium TaxID=3075121 RepID=UPI0028A9160C|nr:hypothetical protein [Halobaculum sp. XH14]